MIKQITFYDGLENGEKITIVFDLNILIKTLYGIGLKLNVKKKRPQKIAFAPQALNSMILIGQ